MNPAASQVRDLAERLIAYEARADKSSGTGKPVACRVCEKLRPHLATLMGSAGVHALLSRALARAAAEVPSLREVEVNADGFMEKAAKPAGRAQPEPARDSVVLVTQLLGLLVDFIGQNLTLRIVREAWPKADLDDFFAYEVSAK